MRSPLWYITDGAMSTIGSFRSYWRFSFHAEKITKNSHDKSEKKSHLLHFYARPVQCRWFIETRWHFVHLQFPRLTPKESNVTNCHSTYTYEKNFQFEVYWLGYRKPLVSIRPAYSIVRDEMLTTYLFFEIRTVRRVVSVPETLEFPSITRSDVSTYSTGITEYLSFLRNTYRGVDSYTGTFERLVHDLLTMTYQPRIPNTSSVIGTKSSVKSGLYNTLTILAFQFPHCSVGLTVRSLQTALRKSQRVV